MFLLELETLMKDRVSQMGRFIT